MRRCPVCECPVELRALPGNLADEEVVRRYYAYRIRDPQYRQPTPQSAHIRCYLLLSLANRGGVINEIDKYQAWLKARQAYLGERWLARWQEDCVTYGCPMIWENLTPTATEGLRWCRHCRQHYELHDTQDPDQPFFPGMTSYADFVGYLELLETEPIYYGYGGFSRPSVDLYLEPVATLNFAQLRLIRDIARDPFAREPLNMLQLKAKYCDQQRHLLIEQAELEQAVGWVDQFIKMQIPFTISAIYLGGTEE
ncbi:MAG: hypothetical protein R3C14_48845 [Caldilineaceae bacterium]